jgi:hypothetical protein
MRRAARQPIGSAASLWEAQSVNPGREGIHRWKDDDDDDEGEEKAP